MSKMDVLVDLQFGSTGKGALAGYLSEKNGYDAVMSCNMPNAGHTAYAPDTGDKFVHKVLPSGIFSPNIRTIGVGPGAVFDINRLVDEWASVCEYHGGGISLVIHEAAGILLPEHREAEQRTLSRIASTMQGSAEALISKIRREEGAIAKYHAVRLESSLSDFGPVRVVDQVSWFRIMAGHENILLEGSQGFSLGISSGFYPFCTSRDCTPARVIADCSMPVSWLRHTYGSCRVHPIRVGNTPDGYSGDWYDDQEETTFAALGVPDETTTVTGRVRRIATFSRDQILQAMGMAMPDFVFLNFANYDAQAAGEAMEKIDDVARILDCGGVALVGHGPLPSDIIDVRGIDK